MKAPYLYIVYELYRPVKRGHAKNIVSTMLHRVSFFFFDAFVPVHTGESCPKVQ